MILDIEKAINRIEYIFEFQEKIGCNYVLEAEDTEAIKLLLNEYKELRKNQMDIENHIPRID